MSESAPKSSARKEATAGIIAGIVLTLAAWLGTGTPGAFLSSHLTAEQAGIARQAVPGAAAVLPTPTATPVPPADCTAPASTVASIGFDPYAILLQKRPDVLQYYRQNGWNPETQCVAIYDDWTKEGAGGKQPTTPVAYVKAQGWAPSAPVATPAPVHVADPELRAPGRSGGFGKAIAGRAHQGTGQTAQGRREKVECHI